MHIYTIAFIAKWEIFKFNFFPVVPAECLSNTQTKMRQCNTNLLGFKFDKGEKNEGKIQKACWSANTEEKNLFLFSLMIKN